MPATSYAEFLRVHLTNAAQQIPALFHAVRRIPYGSTGERDPVRVLATNLGSCSGKHILLRDLLRESGHEAEIITIFTFFNRGLPAHPDMPEDLRGLIEGPDVRDFHHYVRARHQKNNRWIRLDATWHDALIRYGFPVNDRWYGDGDTILAATPIKEYPPVEDLAAWKVQMLEELSHEQREHRAKFFRRLTEWMSTL